MNIKNNYSNSKNIKIDEIINAEKNLKMEYRWMAVEF